ncbi:MAG: cobalt transporter CbiM, partial [Acidobacteriota bacterium]|nr:cobalt transporter CbiM [Acidobacteriota bacterium]
LARILPRVLAAILKSQPCYCHGQSAMHIPDGYLSPSTCAVLYAAAAPFWYVALRRVKKLLDTRLVPLLSVFAAFSFVVMMFNLPLPGGTTGHAIGVGVATVVLGPWASMLAISIALLIQAIFFGDGGITAIGANCFNMAVVGSVVAYAIYRTVARGSGITSTRRMVGAGLAGYGAINVSALFAAVEFGIQPMLCHDASGAPLYAPYPLSVSIPAMMLGHLTLAGLAELIISGGVVAYLQRADPGLLKVTASDAPDRDNPIPQTESAAWPTARKLWAGLAILLVLTPLGILAAGSAWGEWSLQDFANASIHPPKGLAGLSAFWSAPLARYAPGFIPSASFGYFVSAVAGVALIFLSVLLFKWLLSLGRKRRKGFVERTVGGLLEAMEHALFAEQMARTGGLLQRFDPRVKLAGLLALILAAAAVRSLRVLLGLFAFAVVLALLSRISLGALATRVWIAALAFSGAIAIPAIFITPGAVVYRLPLLGWPVTHQGLTSAAFLILRVETAATFSMLLILSTLWTHVLRSLRFFRVPVVFVVILGMTYRYIFLLLQTARDMFESRQSRLIGTLDGPDRRRLAAASAGVLLGKTLQLSGEVHTAMQARGFRGEVRLLDDLRMQPTDWVRLGALAGVAGAAAWLGR